MKIKHVDLIIDEANPFATCQLDRKKYADVLTNLVETYAEGFVLAINNEWGTGKSTFVKMWQQQLKNQGFKTLYFNAWENDFDDKPLPAILSELKTIDLKGKKEDIFKQVVTKASIFADKALSAAIKIVAKQLGADELLQDIVKGGTEGLTAILNSEIDEYAKKKKGIIEFKTILEEYVDSIKNGKPIIFIVDELDRCRPDYAVQVLEQIKHFFSVPGIVFVLSIDKIQLGHAVRGVYGSDQINADEYLRRFIDVEYSIPEPNTNSFCAYLYDYFEFDQFFFSVGRRLYDEFKRDKEFFLKTSALLFNKAGLPLRMQEKIFAHTRIALLSVPMSNYLFPDLFVMLAYIKIIKIDFYKNLISKTLSIENILKAFYEICPKTNDEREKENLIFIEAILILFYNNGLDRLERVKLTDHIGTAGATSNNPIKSLIDTSNDQRVFVTYLNFLEKKHEISGITLQYLINKLDLIDDINI